MIYQPHPGQKAVSFQAERDPNTGLLVGHVSGVPGAHTQGANIDEIRTNLIEVIEMLQEHTGVVLQRSLPALDLDSGSLGAVTHVYWPGLAYEVEFSAQDGLPST